MTKDEKRRLVYEILVEAKALKESTDKVKKEVASVDDSFARLKKQAGQALAGFTAVAVARGFAAAVDEVTKFNEQMKVLGVEGSAVAAGFKDVQDIAFATGQSIHDVAEVYKAATEAGDQLALSQKEIASLANAFTRAAVAEGKSAATAAQQLDTLQFSFDRGSVKLKEFSTLLKENETFQKSAEQALGVTTERLIEMAKAGEIGREQLRKIFDQFQRNAAGIAINATFERLAASIGTALKAMAAAASEAAGLQEATKVSDEMKAFMQFWRDLGQFLGGLVRIIKNVWDAVWTTLRAIAQLIINPLDFKGVYERYKAASDENMEDFKAAFRDIGDSMFEDLPAPVSRVRKTHSEIRDAYMAREKAAADAAAAEAAEKERKAAEKQAAADAKAQREYLEAQAEQKRLASGPGFTFDDSEMRRLQAENLAVAEKELAVWSEGGKQIERNASQLRTLNREQEEWLEKHAETFAMLEEAANVVGDAFYNLFTGATRNAKEFFQQILLGFAQMAAAAASQQLVDALLNSIPLFKTRNSMTLAKGGAFQHGQVIPFATGGVVGGPTNFGLSGGRVGLMGEAGAEAVMPLKRMRDGRLGVSSGMPSVSVINQTGVAAAARVSNDNDRLTIVLEAARMGANLAEARVNRSLRTGYGATAQSIQGTYGLRRRSV